MTSGTDQLLISPQTQANIVALFFDAYDGIGIVEGKSDKTVYDHVFNGSKGLEGKRFYFYHISDLETKDVGADFLRRNEKALTLVGNQKKMNCQLVITLVSSLIKNNSFFRGRVVFGIRDRDFEGRDSNGAVPSFEESGIFYTETHDIETSVLSSCCQIYKYFGISKASFDNCLLFSYILSYFRRSNQNKFKINNPLRFSLPNDLLDYSPYVNEIDRSSRLSADEIDLLIEKIGENANRKNKKTALSRISKDLKNDACLTGLKKGNYNAKLWRDCNGHDIVSIVISVRAAEHVSLCQEFNLDPILFEPPVCLSIRNTKWFSNCVSSIRQFFA